MTTPTAFAAPTRSGSARYGWWLRPRPAPNGQGGGLRLLRGGRDSGSRWSGRRSSGGCSRSALRRSWQPGTTPAASARTAIWASVRSQCSSSSASWPPAAPAMCKPDEQAFLFLLGIGVALACAILVANNLRDIEGDRAAGKRTLATRIGDQPTRILYLMLVALATLMIIAGRLDVLVGAVGAGLVLIIPAVRVVVTGGRGRDLISVLKVTGLAELVASVALAAGLVIARV